MAQLFVFNPENDLSLACGEPNFTPPAMARKIKRDLQLIQIWLCEDGYVYSTCDEINACFVERVKSCFSDMGNIRLYDGKVDINKFSPWGWSRSVISEIRKTFSHLPNVDVEGIRMLSHRKTAVFICEYLKNNLSEAKSIPIPIVCNDEKAVIEAINTFGVCMVKAPWSGSGKGVFRVDNKNYRVYSNWIRSVIQKQGSVVCERFLDKVRDFALEFYSDGKSVKYVGPSIFFNNSRFSYEKAIVASSDILEFQLLKFMSGHYFERLKGALLSALEQFVPNVYTGYFGVDMLVYEEFGEFHIMPCVELNLRMTMGLIANRLGEHILEHGKVGEMSVLWHNDMDSLQRHIDSMKKPVIENGRLKSGSLLLAPIYPDSNYTATLTVVD